MTPEGVAAQVIERVATYRSDAEAAVTVTRETLALTRFAESFIHQNVADESDRIQLQVHVDGRTASAQGNGTSVEAVNRLVESVLAAAALRPTDPTYPGLTAPSAPAGAGNWDEATAAAPPEARVEVVRAFVEAAGGLACAGYCQTVRTEAAFANSAGHLVHGRATEAGLGAVARTGRSDGVARDSAVRLADLDGARSGAAAAAKARASETTVDLPPGRYEVVLELGAVSDLVAGLFAGFNGKAVAEGRSFVELGAAVFDPAVTLYADSTDLRATGLPFDAEGTPKTRLDLVTDGVVTGVPHDRRTAAAGGTVSTGCSVAGAERWGPFPTDVRLAAGTAPELVPAVERGLLITDLWYTRVLDPRTLVYTGLTRNGVWLIEDGVIGPAVSTLRFTQSYLDALAPGQVLGVSADQYSYPGGVISYLSGTGSLLVPHLRLASWNITGGAAG